MASVFSGSEIVEIGITIENNGRDFYNTLVAKSKGSKPKEVFSYLAGEEAKHVEVFKKILSSVRRYEPQESYAGEYAAYMNALAGDYIFTKKNTGSAAARKAKSASEAVMLGIGFEKDSILFYEGMKKAVEEGDFRVVESLIDQERDHLRKLLELKKKL